MTAKIAEISDSITKYGILAALIAAVYYGIKRGWAWIAMPIMFYATIKQLGLICGWQFVEVLDLKYVIIAWVFVFSMLNKMFGAMFEVKHD